MILSADRHDQVLPASVQVRHQRAGRARVHLLLPDDAARRLVVRTDLPAAAARRRAHVDLIAFGHEQQRFRDERRGTYRVAERPQVQIPQQRMIPRTVAVRDHPRLLAAIQIEGCDAAVRRLRQRQAIRQLNEPAIARAIPEAGLFRLAGHEVRDKRIRHRRHVEHAGLRIERRARPIRAAH